MKRIDELVAKARRRRLDLVFVHGEANLRALTGIVCDNGLLVLDAASDAPPVFYTDFRYLPMARRVAGKDSGLLIRDIAKFPERRRGAAAPCRIGYEGSITASLLLLFQKKFPRAKFVDVADDLLLLRAVKDPLEVSAIAAAAAINDRIWCEARREIKSGMTEKDIQRVIRAWMNALGDGEAFETIVCAGANAAECHHVPDDTVWRHGDPLLVDMGVKLNGFCTDMTRCIPARAGADPEYDLVYDLVLEANETAIAAVRPGITGRQLDAIARRIIRRAGYGRAFGHGLGHGVGYEIHEWPVASKRAERADVVLKPGMVFTIEPGIYLEGHLGVRIEDLVIVTDEGCEVLSSSPKRRRNG